eukprot:1776015-Rhodomonas_salina.2
MPTAYDATLRSRRLLCDVRYCGSVWRCAARGTERAYGVVPGGSRGGGGACAGRRHRELGYGVRYCARVWSCGTELAYGAMTRA